MTPAAVAASWVRALLTADRQRLDELTASDVRLEVPGTGGIRGRSAAIAWLTRRTDCDTIAVRAVTTQHAHDITVVTMELEVALPGGRPAPLSGTLAIRSDGREVVVIDVEEDAA